MDKSAFVFPGQGSQYVGMGKHLYEQYRVAKETFEEANEVLGFSLSKLIFEGPMGELGKTENMQLALLVASTATFRVYMQEIGEEPHYLAGHSMGEYAALVCSGELSLTDALAIVKLRGKLSQAVAKSSIGAMTVVNKAPIQAVERICEEASAPGSKVSIACYNGWEQSVIAGHQEALIRAETLLAERNAELAPLMTSPPFHSPLMADAAEELGSELGKVAFSRFQWPVIANVTGQPYPGEGAVAELLTLQMTRPVQWLATMNYLLEHGVTTVVEMGPQAVLTNLFRQHAPSVRAVSFGQKDDRNAVLNNLRQQPAGTDGRRTVVTECLAVAVSTPNRNRDLGECELGIDAVRTH
jgi:[acyl-carrier-protein] S-malonyltransferase